MTVGEHVAVFWDYENCSAVSSVSGHTVANNVRALAHSYGSITTFKAYMEVSEQPSLRSSSLYSELQSSGVSLTHCPHAGRKDVADKMMLVDMIAYAIDHPAPATFVLITGDRDFAYAASILRLRHYRIVLIVPTRGVHLSLKSQASTIFDWTSDVLGKANDELATPRFVLSTRPSNAGLVSTPPHIPQVPVQPSPLNKTTPLQSGVGNFRKETRPEGPLGSQVATPYVSQAPIFIQPNHVPSTSFPPNTTKTPDATTSNSPEADEEDGSPAEAGMGAVQPPEVPTSRIRSLSLLDLSVNPVTEFDTFEGPTLSTDNLLMNEASFDPEIPELTTVNTLDAQWDDKLKSPMPLVPRAEQPDPGKKQLDGADTSKPVVRSDMHERASVSGEHISVELQASIISPSSTKPLPGPISALLDVPASAGPSPAFRFGTISPPIEGTQYPLVDSVPPSPTSIRSPPMQTILGTPSPATPFPAAKVIPLQFRVLVEELKALHSQGTDRPEQSRVAQAVVKRNPNIYTEAGVQAFGAYAVLAKEAGIVLMGTDDGGLARISLHTDWHGAVGESSEHPKDIPQDKQTGNIHPTASPRTHPVNPHLVNQIPAHFLPLIEHLNLLRSEGNIKAKRPAVAIAVVDRDPTIYEAAGVKSFKAYIALAVQAGIVTIGGDGGTSWISLDPNWAEDEFGGELPPKGDVTPAGSVSLISEKSSNDLEVTAAASRPTINTLPPQFQVLVEELEAYQSQGIGHPEKSHVMAAIVKRNKSVYLDDSVRAQKAFNAHFSLAQEAGIILMGSDKDNVDWIALHPDWRGVIGSSENQDVSQKNPATTSVIADKLLGQPGSSLDVTPKEAASASPSIQSTTGSISVDAKQSVHIRTLSGGAGLPGASTALSGNVASSAGTPVPPQFRILVEQLEIYRAQGVDRPGRSNIAAALIKANKNIYKEAGVQSFAAYTGLAQKAGIVELSRGTDRGDTWISLKPEWFREKLASERLSESGSLTEGSSSHVATASWVTSPVTAGSESRLVRDSDIVSLARSLSSQHRVKTNGKQRK